MVTVTILPLGNWACVMVAVVAGAVLVARMGATVAAATGVPELKIGFYKHNNKQKRAQVR